MDRFDLDEDLQTMEVMEKLAKKERARANEDRAGKRAAEAEADETPKKVKRAKKTKGEGDQKEKRRKKGKRKKAKADKERTDSERKGKKLKKSKAAGDERERQKDPETMKLQLGDAAAAFSPIRGQRVFQAEEALFLGYVDLGEDHPQPRAGEAYAVVSASSVRVGRIAFPASNLRRMHLDFFELYVGPPRFSTENNHGMLRVRASTKNPRDPGGSMTDVSFLAGFEAQDRSFAQGFLHRGVLRNLLFQDWVTLSVELHGLGSDSLQVSSRFRAFRDAVPELDGLDVLKGGSYTRLATQLFDAVVAAFSENADDPLWGELPILEVNPTPGGAFLRTGIYLLGEKLTSKKKVVELSDLEYVDGRVARKSGKRLPNHLLFGVSLVEHREG